MKNQLKSILFILPLMMWSCTDSSENTKDQSNEINSKVEEMPVKEVFKVQNVNTAKFQELVNAQQGIVLDVRTPQEVAEGSIDGASFINFYDEAFKAKINFIQKQKPVYVYCKMGGRSSQAADMLIAAGFKEVYNLDGGLSGWMDAGLPVTDATVAPDENIKQLTLAEFNTMLDTDMPVLVDFHTTWCAPCRKMAPIVDRLATEYEGRIKILRLDVDKSKEVAEAFGVKGVPVFVIFKNGEKTFTHTGLMEETKLISVLDRSLY